MVEQRIEPLESLTVDLHDLNAGLTKSVISEITEFATELQAGGIVFITGQGRHSIGLPVLRQVDNGEQSFEVRLKKALSLLNPLR